MEICNINIFYFRRLCLHLSQSGDAVRLEEWWRIQVVRDPPPDGHGHGQRKADQWNIFQVNRKYFNRVSNQIFSVVRRKFVVDIYTFHIRELNWIWLKNEILTVFLKATRLTITISTSSCRGRRRERRSDRVPTSGRRRTRWMTTPWWPTSATTTSWRRGRRRSSRSETRFWEVCPCTPIFRRWLKIGRIARKSPAFGRSLAAATILFRVKRDYLFKLYFLRRLEKRWACNNLVSWPRAFETLAYEGTKLFIVCEAYL